MATKSEFKGWCASGIADLHELNVRIFVSAEEGAEGFFDAHGGTRVEGRIEASRSVNASIDNRFQFRVKGEMKSNFNTGGWKGEKEAGDPSPARLFSPAHSTGEVVGLVDGI